MSNEYLTQLMLNSNVTRKFSEDTEINSDDSQSFPIQGLDNLRTKQEEQDMKPNYDTLFTYCIKVSKKWISLSNAIVAIALINTLCNTTFLLIDDPESISHQSLSNRLLLISFISIGVSLVMNLIAFYALRKAENE